MPVKLHVHYGMPTDPAHFERYFVSTHAPLAAKMPGVRAFEYGKTRPGLDGAQPDTFWIATLTFDDEDAIGAALASPEGRATTADIPNYASGGVTILVSEVM